MGIFDFHKAIVREPGRSVVNGLRTGSGAPRREAVATQHRAYVAALRQCGLEVDVLPPLEEFPDSMFVEDPALVFAEGAILLRPGAPSRAAEAETMRPVLHRHFPRVLDLEEGVHVDGGDVLVTSREVFVGLSGRTSGRGAESVCRQLRKFGREAKVVEAPPEVLHLKSASSLIAEDTVLLTRSLADRGVFDGFRIVVTPEDEEAAANAVRIRDKVLMDERCPRTIDLVCREGLAVMALTVRDVALLDAGLSCMSLRW